MSQSSPPPMTGAVLAIDASAPRSAIAIGRIDESAGNPLIASEHRVDGANQASKTLDLRMRELMQQAGLGFADLVGLACGRGPGTFTGTRVAVATMQGMSLGTGLGVLRLGTLEALAHSLEAPVPGQWVMPLLDARRGEVYAQLFEVDATGALLAKTEPSCAPLSDSLAALVSLGADLDQLCALGPGVEPYTAELPNNALALPGPSAEGLWRAVVAATRAGRGLQPAHELSALYLRATYAELGLNKPKRPVFKNPLL